MKLNFSPFPALSTERLLLRALQLTDDKEIFALRSDDNINKYLDRPKAHSIEDARDFIQKIINGIANNESIFWVITFKHETALAGTICLWNIDKENAVAEIGYELLTQYHGKGIMHEAAKEVIAFSFEQMKLQSIEACLHKDNLASVKLLERNKFIRSLHSRNDDEVKTGNDMLVYKLDKTGLQ